jgi:hypothetical protein
LEGNEGRSKYVGVGEAKERQPNGRERPELMEELDE